MVKLHLAPGLGRLALTALRPETVELLLAAKKAAGLSPSTVRLIRATLRVALGRAMKWGLLQRNAAALSHAPSVKQLAPHQVMTAKQARQFLKAVAGHRNEALYAVALGLGIREGEILGLRLEDYDARRRRLTVRGNLQRISKRWLVQPTKAHRATAVIELPDLVGRALDRKLKVRAAEAEEAGEWWIEHRLIFTTALGEPIHKRALGQEFHALLDKAGLPAMRFHDLRHSVATILLSGGAQPLAVRDLLGHATVKTTLDVYAHVLVGMRRGLAGRMDTALGGRGVASKAASRPVGRLASSG